jgi:Mrp family chromosome partitioning ATPase/capsular polysaccharide biosynthesis protein
VPQKTEETTATLRDYLRVVWLRKWLVIGGTVVGAAGGFLLAHMQTPLYDGTARLMYQQPTSITSSISGSTSVDINSLSVQLQSIGATLNSPSVSRAARSALSAADRQANYTLSAKIVAPTDTASGSAVADIVDVTAETTAPAAAARIANAYAQAVITSRKGSQQAQYRSAEQVIQSQLDLYKTPALQLTTDYTYLNQLLHNLQIAEATATGDFVVILPATAPAAPTSPHPTRSGVLGFGIGLVAAVGAAFVVGQFDTRVRSHRQVAEILGLPVIGRIPRIHRRSLHEGTGLVAIAEPHGGVSEALRILRSNLDWVNLDQHLRSLLVTSSTKGEGKTLTVCNFAVTLARAGKNVIVVDADLRDPRVHRVFNLPNVTGLTSVILGTTTLDKALLQFPQPKNVLPGVGPVSADGQWSSGKWDGSLKVLTSGPLPPNPGEVVASRRFATCLREMSQSDADYVLIDAPPILNVGDAGALAASADGLVIVVDLEQARRPQLTDAREFLDSVPCRMVGIVTVREHVDEVNYRYAEAKAR